MKTVLCIGSVTADVIISGFEKIPPPGELVQFQNLAVEIGGCAANVAVSLAKLGGNPLLCCKIGKDTFGEMISERFAKQLPAPQESIIEDLAVNTTVSIVLVNKNGERGFLYHPGSTSELFASDISDIAVNRSDIIFIAGAMLLTNFDGEACASFLKDCKAKGKFVAMDTAWDFENIWLPKILPSLPYLDLFMPSYGEAAKLTGEADPSSIAKKLRSMGAKDIIIKLGSKGALVSQEKGEEQIIPAFEVVQVVDTTGAGDSFCSGFLYGTSNGWSFFDSTRFGNAVAAHCITKIGATIGIPAADEVIHFMKVRGVCFED